MMKFLLVYEQNKDFLPTFTLSIFEKIPSFQSSNYYGAYGLNVFHIRKIAALKGMIWVK